MNVSSRTSLLHQPRWLAPVAYAAFAVTLPSAIWRVLMITGLLPGTEEMRTFELTNHGTPKQNYVYVFGLSVVQLSTGFLAIGLVRPWGERVAGRRIPVALPVAAGLIGGAAVTWLFDVSLTRSLLAGIRPDQGHVTGRPLVLMLACYAPIFAWGPLVLAATAGYWWRRSRLVSPHSQPMMSRS